MRARIILRPTTKRGVSLDSVAVMSEGPFKAALSDAVASVKDSLRRSALQLALERRDSADIVSMTTMRYGVLFPAIKRAVLYAVGAGGDESAFSVPARKFSRQFSFDLTDEEVLAWVRQHASDLVADLDESSRNAVRGTLSYAWEKGLSSTDAAALVEASIGLTEPQGRTLVSGHDRDVRSGMTAAEVRASIAVKAAALLTARAVLMARHETILAVYFGARSAWRQAVAYQHLPHSVVVRWETSLDERVCPVCSSLDGVTVPLDSPFAPGIYQPGDPHVGCRCSISFEYSG